MGVAVVTTDIGTKFRATIKDQNGKIVDVSDATTLELIFKAPSGKVKTFDAEKVNDGVDGEIEYATKAGDINEAGDWQWQARVVIGGVEGEPVADKGGDWRSAASRFNVVNPIE